MIRRDTTRTHCEIVLFFYLLFLLAPVSVVGVDVGVLLVYPHFYWQSFTSDRMKILKILSSLRQRLQSKPQLHFGLVKSRFSGLIDAVARGSGL